MGRTGVHARARGRSSHFGAFWDTRYFPSDFRVCSVHPITLPPAPQVPPSPPTPAQVSHKLCPHKGTELTSMALSPG